MIFSFVYENGIPRRKFTECFLSENGFWAKSPKRLRLKIKTVEVQLPTGYTKSIKLPMKNVFQQLNIVQQCKSSGLGLWECPPLLFVVMGIVNIVSIFFTYQVATRASEEPELAAIAALVVATIIFTIGTAVEFGFNKVVEANQMKSEFISIISHQLRSPLAIFKWTLNALEEDLQKEKLSIDAAIPIQALNDTNQRMIRLVNMLLEVHRIESGRFMFTKRPLSLQELTEKNIEAEKNYSKEFGVTVTFEVRASHTRVDADKDKLQMAIQNLLDNAIRYSRPKGMVSLSIEEINGHMLLWKIVDTGVGIPEDEQKYIFSKFYRAQNARTYQAEGNGIGLYLSKKIVEEHGGSIGFTSKENSGTTFWFTIPILSAKQDTS